MSPITHLLASWLIAQKTTDNFRDCRLVTFAGLVPDIDGLGLVVDIGRNMAGAEPTMLYQQYHHYLMHGGAGAILTAAIFGMAARKHWRTALLVLLTFHLHLLCDFVGSRGPDPEDVWPIFYFGPFSKIPVWRGKGQWSLDGWQNRVFSLALVAWVFWIAITRGRSVVEVFHRRADEVFVQILRKWFACLHLRSLPR